MIEALRNSEAETHEPICYIISGDLAHIGPKFGDPEPVAQPFLEQSRTQDFALLDRLEAADSQGYFDVIAAEDDRRRICGFPPTCITLEALARPGASCCTTIATFIRAALKASVSQASRSFGERARAKAEDSASRKGARRRKGCLCGFARA